MNWNDPTERARLVAQVGPAEYNRRFAEQRAKSIVATINGHDIWPVQTRFGCLYQVGRTNMAFSTLEQAKSYAGHQ